MINSTIIIIRLKVGSNVCQLKAGDRVIRFQMALSSGEAGNGTWTEWSIVRAESLLKIDPKIDLVIPCLVNEGDEWIGRRHLQQC